MRWIFPRRVNVVSYAVLHHRNLNRQNGLVEEVLREREEKGKKEEKQLDGSVSKTNLQKVLPKSQGVMKPLLKNWHGTGRLHLPGKHVPQLRCSVSEGDMTSTSQWHCLKWSEVTLLSPAGTMLVLMKQVSAGVTLEQTVGDSVEWWWPDIETNDELSEWALNFLSAVRGCLWNEIDVRLARDSENRKKSLVKREAKTHDWIDVDDTKFCIIFHG